MMLRNTSRNLVAAAFLLAAFIGCGSDSNDESGSTPTNEVSAKEFQTECGVVSSSLVKNPISTSDGEPVTVTQVISSNLLVVRREQGDQLIKLHGIGAATTGELGAISLLNSLAANGAYLYEPTAAGCATVAPGGGQGIVAQLVSSSGVSYTEELLRAGYDVQIEPTGSCAEDLISGCYAGMKETYKPKTMGEIRDFLWKPKAESDYNKGSLVIHADPCNATVVVNGQPLIDFGPGNGRCNTSRAFQSGCAFGNGVKVEIFDNDTKLPYTHNGLPYVTVPRGCDRFEFKS